jgi:hypothetical protein
MARHSATNHWVGVYLNYTVLEIILEVMLKPLLEKKWKEEFPFGIDYW